MVAPPPSCHRTMIKTVFLALMLLILVSVERTDAFAPSPLVGRQSSSLHMATWSDSRAVREYQDFLASGQQKIVKMPDCASVIVRPADGPSELADALFQMGAGNDLFVTPGQELPPSASSFPIYITLPPTQLKQFLTTLPDSFRERRDDFIFFSGGSTYGNIEKLLKDYGYCRDTMTQVLITGVKFSPRIQDISVNLGSDSQGEVKWAGECAACGKWQGSIAERLERQNVRCKTGFYREWRRLMWERCAFDAIFNLVGAVRSEPTSLKDVALYYDEEVSDILWSVSGMLRGSRAITLTYGFEERLFGVAEASEPEQLCTLVDDPEMFPFLYEPFIDIPKVLEYMCYAQDELGLLPSVSFLRRNVGKMEKPPVMRQGNLRADGVI